MVGRRVATVPANVGRAIGIFDMLVLSNRLIIRRDTKDGSQSRGACRAACKGHNDSRPAEECGKGQAAVVVKGMPKKDFWHGGNWSVSALLDHTEDRPNA